MKASTSIESTRSIDRHASDWLARRETSNWSAADEATLIAWLEASTANRVAFLRLQVGWKAMDRLKALGAGFPRGSVPPPEQLEPRVPGWCQLSGETLAAQRERQKLIHKDTLRPATGEEGTRVSGRMRASIAAGVLLFVATTAYFGYQTLAGHRYATPVGGLASIPLEDGSIVTLNTATRVRVLFSKKKRLIKLEGGEAFFDVAKDASRPFIVESGERRVTALGTKFSVRRDGGDLQIVVTHGKVRLESPDTLPPRAATGEGGARDSGKVREKDRSQSLDFASQATEGEVLLTAGAVAATHSDKLTVEQRSLSKAEELLSWRTGYLIFQETTLADAVAEFNRYSEHPIRIPDPGVAGIRISGKFRSTNFESFVRLLQDSPQISVRRSGDTIVLTGEAVPP